MGWTGVSGGEGVDCTFWDVGERFVPDRQQRQQVEEQSDERPDQQTTAAETQREYTPWEYAALTGEEISDTVNMPVDKHGDQT